MFIERPDPRRVYRRAVLHAGVKDDGIHHEFVSGLHGEKLDFDRVYQRRRSPTYLLGLVLKGQLIHDISPNDRIGIVGIANGATQHAVDLSRYMQFRYPYLSDSPLVTTKRIEGQQKIVELTSESHHTLGSQSIDTVVLDDDVGTTGSSTAQPVPDLLNIGFDDIFAAYDWIRSDHLPYLDELGVPAYGLIEEVLPNFTPSQCNEVGLCMQGLELVRYK